MKLEFMSSSQNKADELSKVLGGNYKINRVEVDLPEIQSLDPQEIIQQKLQAASERYPREILVVEDTSFEVDALNKLPGTFIKFFEQTVDDSGIYKMARGLQTKGDLTARAKVIIGLLHRGEIKFFAGTIEGKLSEQKGQGWGFDRIFVPNGYDERMGTLGPEVKSKISHRAQATKKLKEYLDSL